MWQEQGVEYRQNIVEPGGSIPLHAHSYAHIAEVNGRFDCTVIAPDGTKKGMRFSGKSRIGIPAWHQHTFVLRDAENAGDVLCMWPTGATQ